MLGYKPFLLVVVLSVQCLVGAGKKNKHASVHKKVHVRNFIQGKNAGRNPFHSTEDVNDLVKNPSALSSDEANAINNLDSMTDDVFMNPEVTSESRDLSGQGLDPSVAMQISKMDHNLQDIIGSRKPSHLSRSTAKQKGEILQGYGEQYNTDGSVNLANNDWPEYQMKDTPPMIPTTNINKQTPNNMFLGNGDSSRPQISPQAALNPNLLPGQKSDLGMGMGVGMQGIGMGMGKGPGGAILSRFVDDIANGKSSHKSLMKAPFAQPEIKNAGFRIPGEFSFKGGERKSAQSQEDANFVKNFMSSKKSRTEKRKTTKKNHH